MHDFLLGYITSFYLLSPPWTVISNHTTNIILYVYHFLCVRLPIGWILRYRIAESKVCAFGILLDSGEFSFIRMLLIHLLFSVSQSCLTLCDPMDCSTPGFPVPHHLPELSQTHAFELVLPSNYLILCHPLLLLLSIFPSFRIFSNKSALHPLQYSCLENPMDRRAW